MAQKNDGDNRLPKWVWPVAMLLLGTLAGAVAAPLAVVVLHYLLMGIGCAVMYLVMPPR